MNHFYQNINGWSSETEQGELLEIILNELSVNEKIKIAEIGVFNGRLTAMWNVILINNNVEYEYHAIDHFNGSKEHQNETKLYEKTITNLQPIINKIEIIRNTSEKQSYEYVDNYFDIIYIDASHDYESAKQDIECWYPKVKIGGFISGDDYVDGWPGVMKAVNEKFNKINVKGQQWYIRKI